MEERFPKLEEQVLRKWKQLRAFEKSVELRKRAPRFVFYEGPPTANGTPGIHHVLTRSFKDIMCRFKTMRGFYVERRAGWDTHGLPVELQVEKELGLQSKRDIERYGIAKFNKACKQSVWRYQKEWEDLTERIGFWLDTEHPYITYERSYMETLWWIMKHLWEQGLLYQGHKIVPYCARCGTPLSSHETAQGYKTVTDTAVTVKLRISKGISQINLKSKLSKNAQVYFLAWTTTPWTLPGNVALAVGKHIAYVAAQKNSEVYIVAKELAERVLGGEYKIVAEFSGKDLEGIEYEPLYRTLEDQSENKYFVALGNFVNTEEGTGIVHTAVMYGEDDYQLGQKLGLPKVHTVNEEGRFTDRVAQWKGEFVKDGNVELAIIEDLHTRGLLFKKEQYQHEYPFCWRCSTPLLYYAKESWFINMQGVKRQLIENNAHVNWAPAYIKEGRFGGWLKELKDWTFSRERYWGTPLPIWRCGECGKTEAIGSLSDFLEQQYSTNTYYIVRHGESTRNTGDFVSSWPETKKVPLTEKGVSQAKKAAKELKKKKIDIIIASDLLRTKQTAELIAAETGAKIVYEKKLRENNAGEFNGKQFKDFISYFQQEGESPAEHYLRRFEVRPPKGETWKDVQKRMREAVKGIERKYKGKNILIVGHELPLTLLEGLMQGFSREEVVAFRMKKQIKTGEWRKVPVRMLPYNDEIELDFHRPYVDEVEFACAKCKRGSMKRVKDVVDVWFDSGAMPFAQAHWPFEKAGSAKQKSKAKKEALAPEQFPADYITEAIDQTRGWFYTLLAVSTLLGFGSPYKNVISLGHVLDEKGEKMSKSKGNVVSPWEMISKYGSDALRWYFFTINHPGDSKLFSEKELQQASRRFISTLWNSYVFYDTYASKKIDTSFQPTHALDRWIISRFHTLATTITTHLEAYNVVDAARALETFVVDDLSLWYIRRSRSRLQSQESKREYEAASHTLGMVLLNVSILAAPFIPFLSETIFSEIKYKQSSAKKAKQAESVHWQDWVEGKPECSDIQLEEQMKKVREIVSLALAERSRAGIKVRQPLSLLKINVPKTSFSEELLTIIGEEVNVKEVVQDSSLKETVELDTTITTELKEEGMVRELIRAIQEMRKHAGYKPHHYIQLQYDGGDSVRNLIAANEVLLKKSTGIKQLEGGRKLRHTWDLEREFEFAEDQQIWLGIKRL